MAATNPFDPVSTVTRARFHASPGDWDEVTESHRFQDGGIAFNELNDTAGKVWTVIWTGLSEAEAAPIDAFYEEKKLSNSFTFETRLEGTYSAAYFLEYTRDHTKVWAQTRECKIIAYPNAGTFIPTTPTASVADVEQTTATLNWTASTAPSGTTIAGYEYRLDGGSWVDVGLVLTKALTGLADTTAFTAEVRAYDDSAPVVNSSISNVVNFTTLAPLLSDADAIAFDAAIPSSLTDAQKIALNDLVLDLKAFSLWTGIHAIYPMLGGTADDHKFNLKDPQDTDGAFRIVWTGGLTHSSNGVIGNGTTGYGDTKYAPSADATLDDVHYSFYSRTDEDRSSNEIGGLSGSGYDLLQLRSGGTLTWNLQSLGLNNTISNPDSLGMYEMTRRGNTDNELYKDGVSFDTSVDISDALMATPHTIFLLARGNSGTPQLFSSRQCAFASIGTKHTDTEAANFNTAVTDFQTALSRNV